MKPKDKVKQIENRENWIVEFWRVRGYEEVRTALGISFTLHRKNPRYDCLGLDLTYLEQFENQTIKNIISDLENWNNNKGLSLHECIEKLKDIHINKPKEELIKDIKRLKL